MIIRDYCSCTVCSTAYKIRFGVGSQFPQIASFFCSTCGEKLTYGFNKDRTSKLENLAQIAENEDAVNINLHPELLMDKAAMSNPYHFASLDFMIKQQKNGDDLFGIMRLMQVSIVAHNKGWDEISKDFRFVKEMLFNLVDVKYGKHEHIIKRRVVKKTLECTRLFLKGPWENNYSAAISELEKARKLDGFNDFKMYLAANYDTYVDYLFDIMTDFSIVRNEMLTTLMAQKCEHPILGISSTAEWGKIEKVYGDLYERYGDLVMVLTAINNLNSRGNFRQFNTVGFTFENYLDSDKANRCKNFENNSELTGFSFFFEASIRNGTHHKNSKINKEGQQIILGVGKGGKTEKTMSFVEYISYCNEIHARCLIMLNLIFKVLYS